MTDENMDVLVNVIGAVESGGQIYGRRNYAAYAGPHTNSELEVTITLGWAQNYGAEAYKLVSLIYAKDPNAFNKLDPTGQIKEKINGEHDWVAEKWNPSTYQRYVLIALIDSKAGHDCQNELFKERMTSYIAECEKAYTKDVKAVMMYCEIRHLGGKGAASRIFDKCMGDYSLMHIMSILKNDQTDTSSDNQVGDIKYWSRHVKCREFIEKYAVDESEASKMTKTESAVKWMESHANDNSHGYDQIYRWGEKGDYDCSAAVITAWESAGVPVKTNGASYTGNMLSVFLKCGFTDITSKVNLSTGAGLIRGDVLLKTGHHTAMYCGNGKEVEASINENGTATGGKPGDQTGKEFLIRSYRNYPWNHVLRYTASGTSTTVGSASTKSSILKKGASGEAVKTMQSMLIACGYSCGTSGADGQFGTSTYNALIAFQKAHSLEADGIYGPKTKAALEATQSVPPRIDLEVQCLNRGRSGKKVGGGEICMANDAIVGLSIGATLGGIEYRVHKLGGGWYNKITKCDWGSSDAYAGDLHSVIDGVQIYFKTDTSKTGGKYYRVKYQVKTQHHGWLGEIFDTNWEANDGNHTAGIFGDPIIGIRAKIVS